MLTRRLFPLIATFLLAGWNVPAQKEKPVPACSQTTFAAFKPLPKLEYDCPEGLIESDDKILRLPARRAALRAVAGKLEAFTNRAWWQAGVNELNACQVHGAAGLLNDDEKQKWKDGDYGFDLFGNHQMRLAVITDPCYQTGYSGSTLFLIYNKGGRAFVSQLLNGYYSRADNSVGIGFAELNGQQLVEISTGNSMPPSLRSYYFVIDSKTNQAIPKKLFQSGNKLTNEIYSAMLLDDPGNLGLPKNATELKIIDKNRLAPAFSAYEESERGKIDSNGRKLRRIVYRWNGRFYAVQNRSR